MTQENKVKNPEQNNPQDISMPGSDTAYIQPVIGELGWDTREAYKGLFGLGTSSNNGVDFHVFLTFNGLNFDDDAIPY